jgi:hypothetical protein
MGDGNGMRPLKAEAVAAGDRLLTPAAGTAAEVVSTEVQRDDFGTPALVVATLRSGETLRIAAGSDVQIAGTAASGVELGADAGDGEQPPETVVAHAAAVHPESAAAGQIASRLARGVNLRSGANLQDLSHLAELLFADLADSANALRVCELLAPLPYDGNYGRWKWIENCLAIASFISREAGDDARAEAYSESLRSADSAEADPLRAKLAAALKQRQLDEPNLYSPEIARASAAGDAGAEREWRLLRLGVLLYLRAHGGSTTLSADELTGRIRRELAAVRTLAARTPAQSRR